jgi:GDP-L-fucose synthase
MALSTSGRVFITGHRGMVGSALMRALAQQTGVELLVAQRRELDLLRQTEVEDYLCTQRPETVIIAAAKVGGIHANNTYPADFLYENLMIATNLVHGSFKAGVRRVLFLGSSCIYPREAPQPMTEECLLTSPLEKTNEAYAIAKIAGLKLCQHYRTQHGVLYHSAMPTNLYGPGDNYHPENSHVIPALIRRFHEAKVQAKPEVVVWGTGTPRREFLHVDDLAAGCLHLLAAENPPDWVNIGAGDDLSIGELAALVAEVVGYPGQLVFDLTKPDGTPRKLMDVGRMKELGWAPKIGLREGLVQAYADFQSSLATGSARAA